MNEQLIDQVNAMSEEDQNALLGMTFSEEIEKQAEAAIQTQGLADALYAYGAYCADRELAVMETESDELSKEASAEFDAAETEIVTAMDSAIDSLGIANSEDSAELHQQAQAAASLMLEGYTDQFEKVAKKKEKEAPGKLQAMRAALKKHWGKAMKKVRAAGGYLSKHRKPILAVAGGGAALTGAALLAKKHMDKKASELSVAELTDAVMQKIASEDLVIEGIVKLAKKGAEKAVKSILVRGREGVEHAYGVSKKYLKQHGKAMAGAGAVGGAAGVAAGRASKE